VEKDPGFTTTAPRQIKTPSIAHRLINYSVYGIIPGAIWGLLIGRTFQEELNFLITLLFNIIAGAIIGPIIGFSRKKIIHLFGALIIVILSLFIGVLITLDTRGVAYALSFGPAAGTFLSMIVKFLKDKGVLL
jgi:hypothetical protein